MRDSGQILQLVEQALDEFESVSLEATVRRAVRIANLLGETAFAIRLSLELRAVGGDPAANRADIERLMPDPSMFGVEAGSPSSQALHEYMSDRQMSDDRILVHSLAELNFWDTEPGPGNNLSATEYAEDLTWRHKRVEILARTRSRTFSALCAWERQLLFSTRTEHTFEARRQRVEALLAEGDPEIVDKFNAVFRRLDSAATAERDPEAREELSQAVTSCRRILKAVVDAVQPADRARPLTEDGEHQLTDDAYRNRLFEFLKATVASGSFEQALSKAASSLFERFAAADNLSNKGVHARVARQEAEFCALNTYLLGAEVLYLADAPPAASRS